ncbi:MAG: hypothetical protein ACREE2_01040 [Stellaceae bacterium]
MEGAVERHPRFCRECVDQSGCGFIFDDGGSRRCCGAERRPGSPYCPEHHALCHVAGGSMAETRRLREVEALATAVGGRRGNNGTAPSQRFLNRLRHAVREFS